MKDFCSGTLRWFSIKLRNWVSHVMIGRTGGYNSNNKSICKVQNLVHRDNIQDSSKCPTSLPEGAHCGLFDVRHDRFVLALLEDKTSESVQAASGWRRHLKVCSALSPTNHHSWKPLLKSDLKLMLVFESTNLIFKILFWSLLLVS